MKIQVNDVDLFCIEEWEKKLLANDILEKELEKDLKRRLEWSIRQKIDQCYARFEKEWLPKLQEDPEVTALPASKKEFVEFVLRRPDYKDREAREKESWENERR